MTNSMTYQKISQEEQKCRGILGRLVGIICDYLNPTRNGRLYNEELWDKVFSDPLMQEKIANRVSFGEIKHPTDGSLEVDPEKVAVCLAEMPKKDNKGHYVGVFDILDTPCGRILKTFLDYGSTVGISSRGEGEITTDMDGNEIVDPDTYFCCGWDIVLVPGVEAARLTPVVESLDIKKQSLKEALQEVINNSSEEDKKIMQDVVDTVELDEKTEMLYNTEDKDVSEQQSSEDEKSAVTDNIDTEANDVDEVANSESQAVQELQEALLHNTELENKIVELQEKLSVCYAKEAKYEDLTKRLSEQKSYITKLVKSNKDLSNKIVDVNSRTKEVDLRYKHSADRASKLNESLMQTRQETKTLQESYDRLTEKSKKLAEDLSSANSKLDSLREQYKKDKQNYASNLEKSNKLVEKYKRIAGNAVNYYIESQASKLGCNVNEIKNRLPESYTFKDIDSACAEIQRYKIGLSKLPFRQTGMNESIMVSHRDNAKTTQKQSIFDDDVDESLLNLARMN